MLAAAAAAAGFWVCFEVTPDFTDRVRDDAYYEFAWAANLAAGRGPSVSDGVTTSGVQLLWSLCLVPFAWLFGAGSLPVLAPWLGLLLHATGALVLWRAGRDRTAARCVALCWLGHPLLLRECMNGQETALASVLLLLLWLGRRSGAVVFWTLGLLVSLARSDLLPAVAALSLVRHGARWWRGLALPAVLALVHLGCNAALGGGLLPDSAAPMAWLWHANHELLQPSAYETAARWWWFVRPVLLGNPWATASAVGSGLAVFAVVRPFWPRRLRALPAVLVGAAAALGAGDLLVAGVAAALLALFPAAARRPVSWDLLGLLAGAAALVVVHWGLRWYPRDYYLAPLVVLAVAALLHHRRLRWLLAGFAMAQLVSLSAVSPEPLAAQEAMALAGRHLGAVLPAGERVGCFNSGLVTFSADVLQRGTSQRRAVVNLDGVVDSRAFAALRAGRLGAWLDERQIRFVLDDAGQFATDPGMPHANGPWFAADFAPERDLVELARFVLPAAAGDPAGRDRFRLYWRVDRGVWPQPPTAARELGPWRGGRCVLWPAQVGQQLEEELASGERRPLAMVDRATIVVLAWRPAAGATGRLFVRGQAAPLPILPGE